MGPNIRVAPPGLKQLSHKTLKKISFKHPNHAAGGKWGWKVGKRLHVIENSEMRLWGFTGSLVADIQQKPHSKHLANCIYEAIHMILLK